MSISSYPSIFAVGHRMTVELLAGDVIVEEKVDGSQFSFKKDEEGNLHCRSKGAVQHFGGNDKMFNRAMEVVEGLKDQLTPGWTYRAEYLQKPKHNTLAYDRVPEKNLIIFDIMTEVNEEYLPYAEKAHVAELLGLETVPLVFSGTITGIEHFKELLDRTSILGGQKIEGVVIKPAMGRDLYGPDKKPILAKFVSEAFKEVHQGEFRKSNPTGKDILQILGDRLRSEARWNKAIQHLRESSLLTDSPKDIGPLIKEIQADVFKEEEERIKNALYGWAKEHIARAVIADFPEWYKEKIASYAWEVKGELEEVA